MDNNNILKIVLVVAIIACAGTTTYLLFFNEHYETVQISNSASLEMPVGNGINTSYVNGTSIYSISNGKGVSIMSYNSINTDLGSAFGFAAVKELFVGSAHNEGSLYETTINGSKIYAIATGNDATHDNILIASHDKGTTMKIYESIKYNTANASNNTNKSINVERISSDDQPTQQSTQSSQQVNDNYVRDSNGNIIYAHVDVGGDVPMTKDGHYSYKSTDEPGSPSGWWVDKI